MLRADVSDPPLHCPSLFQSSQGLVDRSQTFEPCVPPFLEENKDTTNADGVDHEVHDQAHFYTGCTVASMSPSPPKGELDYEGALQFLFTEATKDPNARALCRELDMRMEPPVKAGILLYLLRLQALGRIDDWPLLFGAGNSFILYLLEKMYSTEILQDSENERLIWDMRRKETEAWMKGRR